MKKLLPVVAVAAAMTLWSCGGSSKSETSDADTSLLFEETEMETDDFDDTAAAADVDTDAESRSMIDELEASSSEEESKTLAEKAKAYVETLLASGQVEAAKEYMAKVGPYIKKKVPRAFDSMKNLVSDEALESAKEKAAEAKEKLDEKASASKEKAKDALDNLLNR